MGKPRADPLGFLTKPGQPLPVNALFLKKLLTSSWALAGSECLTTVKKPQHKITVQDASVTCPTKPQKLDTCSCTAKGSGYRSGPNGRRYIKSGQTRMAPTTATNHTHGFLRSLFPIPTSRSPAHLEVWGLRRSGAAMKIAIEISVGGQVILICFGVETHLSINNFQTHDKSRVVISIYHPSITVIYRSIHPSPASLLSFLPFLSFHLSIFYHCCLLIYPTIFYLSSVCLSFTAMYLSVISPFIICILFISVSSTDHPFIFHLSDPFILACFSI